MVFPATALSLTDTTDQDDLHVILHHWTQAVTQGVQTIGALGSSNTLTLDHENQQGSYLTGTLDANCALTFPSVTPSGRRYHFWLHLTQDGTGTRTVTWPTITWANGQTQQPLTGAGAQSVFFFWTTNAGSTWYGERVFPLAENSFPIDGSGWSNISGSTLPAALSSIDTQVGAKATAAEVPTVDGGGTWGYGSLSSISGAQTLPNSDSDGTFMRRVIDGDTTFTPGSVGSGGREFLIIVRQDGTGGRRVKWSGATLINSEVDSGGWVVLKSSAPNSEAYFKVRTWDSGSTWTVEHLNPAHPIETFEFTLTALTEQTYDATIVPVYPVQLLGVYLHAGGGGPAGGGFVVDLLKNGTTVYSTTGNRPTIPDGGDEYNPALGSLPAPDVTAVAALDELQIQVVTQSGAQPPVTGKILYRRT